MFLCIQMSGMGKRLKIGILGTRGIPNRYGGFEQCAEMLALGLTGKGHEVWVYNAHNHEYQENTWNGAHIIHCYDPEHKIGTAGQFIYDLNCIRDARGRGFDVLLQLGYTSNSIWYKLWPKNCSNIINMDGLEWKRSKYNKYTQKFLKYAEKWAALHGDMLIADSPGIRQYLKQTYLKDATFIPYGAPVFIDPQPAMLKDYGLLPFTYDVILARMEPENNIETIIKGVIASNSGRHLIIIGKTDNKFGQYLKSEYANDRIKFTGGIYDQKTISNLRYHSLLYFHGHSVGGTNPSLLEAMGSKALVVAHDNIFNKSVLGNDAFYFIDGHSLAGIINNIARKDDYEDKIQNNLTKIKTKYSWQHITDEYEQAFFNATFHP